MRALITICITIPKQTLIYDIFPWLIWDSCLSQDLWAILSHKNWSLQGLVDPTIFSPVQLLFILCTPLQATINFMPLWISSCTSASFILFTIGNYLPTAWWTAWTTIPLNCSFSSFHLPRCYWTFPMSIKITVYY